ncbi:hypothetical protein SAMN02745147_1159 [Intestinibacter bartlettii DSM 16795]|nr:hypothetical protein SAMN02745147_1159 [Intestinibacter bartlettii DSM 16795]
MKKLIKSLDKLNSYFYFSFWGFYFSAGYFYCKTKNKLFIMSSKLTYI